MLGTPQLRDVEKPLGGCLWWPQEVCPSGSQWNQQEAVAVRGPSAGSLLRMAFLLLPLDPGQPAGSPSTGDTTTQPTDDGLPALGSAISGLLIEGEKAQDGVYRSCCLPLGFSVTWKWTMNPQQPHLLWTSAKGLCGPRDRQGNRTETCFHSSFCC